MRDYRTHLQAVLKRRPAAVNSALAETDDLYIRRHLGAASAARLELPATAPRALSQRDQLRYLRAVQASPLPRDQALALTPFYAGARISEIVGLDIDDVRLSARKGTLRIYGKGARVREIPISRSPDIFSVPRTTVYGHLDAASKGKRPAAHRSSDSATDSSV